MDFITKIRERIGKFVLRREYAHASRNRRICNMEGASSIGILYYLPNVTAYEKVSAYVRRLQDQGKIVKALGYVESKHLTGQFLPRLSYDFLYHSGLSWDLKPNSTAARDFLETEFDILIDLSTDDRLPLLFITALSKARFKVGLQSEVRTEYLDLMISLQGKGELDELITQIDHYLYVLNNKNEI